MAMAVVTWLQHHLSYHLVKGARFSMLSLPSPGPKEGQVCLIFTIRAFGLLMVVVHMHEQSH